MISRAAALAIGSSAFTPGNVSIDSRMTPMRTPFSDPVAPGAAALAAYGVSRTLARGTVVKTSRGS